MQMVAFSIKASAPPFPVFVMAFAINGFGGSLQDAQANGFVASYKNNAAAKMGIIHAAYGKYTYCARVSAIGLTSSLCEFTRRWGVGIPPHCDTIFPAS